MKQMRKKMKTALKQIQFVGIALLWVLISTTAQAEKCQVTSPKDSLSDMDSFGYALDSADVFYPAAQRGCLEGIKITVPSIQFEEPISINVPSSGQAYVIEGADEEGTTFDFSGLG